VRTLVLGGTRFFGLFVVDELRRRGQEVAVLSRRAGGPIEASVQYLPGDASDPQALREAVRSWRPGGLVDMLHHRPEQASAVMEACAGEVVHAVHLSCASVYGPRPVCPIDESTEVMRPEAAAPSVAAQIAADTAVLEAAAEGRWPGTLLRLPRLYGPRDPGCAEWFFAKRGLDGRRRVAVPDAGFHICHRGFAQNMAWGVAQALATRRAIGEAYNLGEEKLYTLAQLAQGVARALRHEWELYSVPGHLWHTPYQYTSFFDLRKARAHLRYRDRMIPRDGLELTVAWLCQQPRGEDWCCPEVEAPFDYAREDALIDAHGVLLEG